MDRYFIVKYVKELDSRILLGKYGLRVKNLVDDGYTSYKSADNMCCRKTLKALQKNISVRYSVVKLDV